MRPDSTSRKLSPQIQQALETPGEGAARLNLLVATHGVLEGAQRQQLESIGCHVRTVAGDVVTADLPAGALPELTALDFVKYVELSRRLHLEPREPPHA